MLPGARSEATLPDVWWRETLHCSPSIEHWHVLLAGPETPHKPHISVHVQHAHNHALKPDAECQLACGHAHGSHTTRELHIQALPPTELHSLDRNILQSTSLVVMFNPGTGSPALKDRSALLYTFAYFAPFVRRTDDESIFAQVGAVTGSVDSCACDSLRHCAWSGGH
jgi:hypothetical protein